MSDEVIVYQAALQESGNFEVGATNSTYSLKYYVMHEPDIVTACNLVGGLAPTTKTVLAGQQLIRGQFKPKLIGFNHWEIDVEYKSESKTEKEEKPGEGEEPTYKISFDTSGGMHKITESLKTLWKGAYSEAADPAPDLLGAINWDGKNVNGVDIYVGKLEFTIDVFYSPSFFNLTVLKGFAKATGKKNKLEWIGFEIGELLFLGAQGSLERHLAHGTPNDPVKVSLKFAYSENQQNIKIGGITVPQKRGWDYLWVRYKKILDQGKLVPTPVHAYVEQVYEEESFAQKFYFGTTE